MVVFKAMMYFVALVYCGLWEKETQRGGLSKDEYLDEHGTAVLDEIEEQARALLAKRNHGAEPSGAAASEDKLSR